MEKHLSEPTLDFAAAAAVVLFFGALVAIAVYAMTFIEQPDLFL